MPTAAHSRSRCMRGGWTCCGHNCWSGCPKAGQGHPLARAHTPQLTRLDPVQGPHGPVAAASSHRRSARTQCASARETLQYPILHAA